MFNLDGIQKNKRLVVKRRKLQTVKVESVLVTTSIHINKTQNVNFFSRFLAVTTKQKVPVLVAVAGLLVAFGAGSWSVLSSHIIEAEDKPTVLGESINTESLIPVANSPVATYTDPKVSNEVILSLTLSQIEGYLNEALKTPELKKEEILALRKSKLKTYLAEKKSPFVAIVDTIAELKHWKLVLAISNSESTLGKRCYNNNCSGIGVEPGHRLWRDYASKADWAKDLDRLIERRYKDWKLEEMNGVYNQPGSDNWIYAATQIIEELKERGIE